MTTGNQLSENEQNKISTEEAQTEIQERKSSFENQVPDEETDHQEEHVDDDMPLSDALKEMEKIINSKNAGENFKKFNALKEKANRAILDEIEEKKPEFVEAGEALENLR